MSTQPEMTTFAERKPRKGQRIEVSGSFVHGGVPAKWGTLAVYCGMLRGSVVLEGNTSDRTFANPKTTSWRPR